MSNDDRLRVLLHQDADLSGVHSTREQELVNVAIENLTNCLAAWRSRNARAPTTIETFVLSRA